MVKSRFLGKPPKMRSRPTMVRVGVSDFVDEQARNARLIAAALDAFRTTFVKNREVRTKQKKVNVCGVAAAASPCVIIDCVRVYATNERVVFMFVITGDPVFFFLCSQSKKFFEVLRIAMQRSKTYLKSASR